MGKTNISWTDMVWNPTTGCSKVSAGCKNCYAERTWKRLSAPGQPYAGRKFTDVACHPDRLDQPLRWKKPRRIFIDSMSDLFHPDVPFEFIAKVWDTMFDCGAVDEGPQHIFQILTKRPKRVLEFDQWMAAKFRSINYRNVWLGVSVENQATADERIPILLQTPAAVRFISYEPMLDGTDLSPYLKGVSHEPSGNGISGIGSIGNVHIDWVIVGGESGPWARPIDIEWIRQTVEQCRAAGVPVFVKQDSGLKPSQQGRIPDELWIKEMPNAKR